MWMSQNPQQKPHGTQVKRVPGSMRMEVDIVLFPSQNGPWQPWRRVKQTRVVEIEP
jgi:hypothetical protein